MSKEKQNRVDHMEMAARNEQLKTFEKLRDCTYQLLERFGRPDYLPGRRHGDYQVLGDFSGYPQVVVFIDNLKMLRPPVISALQKSVKGFPGWEIEVAVAPRAHRDWPNMGLYIRPHEIIDGLQRQYFPTEFQNIEYEGARRGTAYD